MLEYYALYTKIVDKRSHKFEDSIRKKSFKILSTGNAQEDYNLRDFKQSLLSKLYLNKIISSEFLEELIPRLKSLYLISYLDILVPMRLDNQFTLIKIKAVLSSKHFSEKQKVTYIDDLNDDFDFMATSLYDNSMSDFVKNFSYSDTGITRIFFNFLKYYDEENQNLYKKAGHIYLQKITRDKALEKKHFTDNQYTINSILELLSYEELSQLKIVIIFEKLIKFTDSQFDDRQQYNFRDLHFDFKVRQKLILKPLSEIITKDIFLAGTPKGIKSLHYLYLISG